MAKDKKPDKNNGSKKGSVTCERTYVLDRCSRNQETRRSPPSSPSTIRVIDLPSRHQRRGAVRDKRTVSIDQPRPAHQRADNAYVETSFVDSVVPLQLQGSPVASCSSAPYCLPYSRAGCSTAEGNGTGLPVIAFQGMRSSAEPPPRPGEGIIDEFPAYVPWKAEQRAEEDSSACNVCHKCRCATCQKLCKYPGMRVCGVLDMRSRCDEACVETTTVCVPCVQKTARCAASNVARAEAKAARAEANAARAQAAAAAAAAAATAAAAARAAAAATAAAAARAATAAANNTAADANNTAAVANNAAANAAIADANNAAANNAAANAAIAEANDAADAQPEDGDDEPQTASGECRLRWLMCWMCIPCPYCTVDGVTECSTGCRGNVNVSGCECVDWEALRQNNRRRVNAAAAAVAASRDRRRCRDYHYYITTMSQIDNANGKAGRKNNIFRRLLRF